MTVDAPMTFADYHALEPSPMWLDECHECGDATTNGEMCRGCSAIEFRQQCAEEK